jgi:hypothetical protein
MHYKVPLPQELAKVHLQRIPTRASELSHVADGDSNRWIETGDQAIKQRILYYNEDLHQQSWLSSYR